VSPQFVNETKPIIYKLAELTNEVLAQTSTNVTWGESKALSEKTLQKTEELHADLLKLVAASKKEDKIYGDLNGLILISQNLFSSQLRSVEYYLDNAKLKWEIDRMPDGDAGKVSQLQQYEDKNKMIDSLNNKEIPILFNQQTESFANFLRQYKKIYQIEVASLFPVIKQSEMLQKQNYEEEKALSEKPLELPAKEIGSERFVCLADVVKAFGYLNEMQRSGQNIRKEDMLNTNNLRKQIQLVDAAMRLMKRSEITLPNDVFSKLIASFTQATTAMSECLNSLVPLLENLSSEAVPKVHVLTEKIGKIWEIVFFDTSFVNYIYVEATDKGTHLAISTKEADKLLGIIRETFKPEIEAYEKGVITDGDKYITTSTKNSYAGMLMIYLALQKFTYLAKFKEQGVDWENLPWDSIQATGLYRNASTFGKYAIRETFFESAIHKSKTVIPENKKSEYQKRFLAEHPL